ncbi:PREDICTED: uncharacterized protein LOC107194199 isoform X2 [Dufourea novaeangliae]|uniref:Uncharacterized protein n=1 Tax=Dufourea novaeangliae TaxID=178035 RepID=A0A154P150_DUFNO|nr:PREDICTED: uncharacterized protein LOC107194199 isoform X2 [Dufourea novaeangliae]KZC05655.1 hypothetical protein WN55_04595 [Dufourea novaeangliae]
MSSSSDNSQSSQVRLKRGSVFCSTPVKTVCRKTSIGFSTVSNGSSSSVNTEQNVLKNKWKAQRKEDKQLRKDRKKKKKITLRESSDSDWITERILLDDEKENRQPNETDIVHTTPEDVLYMGIGSPERLRRAEVFLDKLLDSPTILPHRREDKAPRKIDLEDRTLLPLIDLPPLQYHFDDSDEEEELKLRARDRKKQKKKISIDKTKRWLVDMKIPTASADLLWDQYMQAHPEEMVKYAARCSRVESSSSGQQKKSLNKGRRSELWPELGIPKHMTIARGYLNKFMKKSIRTYNDVYNFPEPPVDWEFQRNPETGAPNISLNEYLLKCKNRKQDEDIEAAGPSCSRNNRHTKKNMKYLKKRPYKNIDKKKAVRKVYSSDSKNPELVSVDVSDEELDRILEIRSFELLLDEIEEKTAAKEKSCQGLNRESQENSTEITRKRRSEGEKNVAKRPKMAAKNKPVIRSIETLKRKYYKEGENHWRIT